MPDGPLNIICEALHRFSEEPERNGSDWTRISRDQDESMASLLQATLKDNLTDVTVGLSQVLERVVDPKFAIALEHMAVQAGLHGAEQRQLRHAEALVRTAIVAVHAREAEGNRADSLPEIALPHLERSCQLLAGPSRICRTPNQWKERFGSVDGAELVRRALLAIEGKPGTSLSGCAAARCWINLYWLRQDEGYTANLLTLPTATTHSRAARCYVGSFTVRRRPSGRVAALIEDPGSALLCLGSDLVSSIQRAWEAAEEHTATWRIEALPTAAQDDESLSGAAAVLFQALATDANIRSDVLILARLNEDRQMFEGVEAARAKIDEALSKGPQLSIVVGGGRPPDRVATRANSRLTEADFHALEGRGVRIEVVGNLTEAMYHAGTRRSVASRMGNYELVRKLPSSSSGFELWEARRGTERYILKAWEIDPKQHILMRGSWDRELRTLYRIGSLPQAEELLLPIRDSFVEDGRFALVMRAAGRPFTLLEALRQRSSHSWLDTQGLYTASGRLAVWAGLLRLAKAIRVLHSQNVVHRNLSAECVYFADRLTEETLRLGGFEWSVRVGGSMGQDKPSIWATPPDFARTAITVDMDWYGFGMLAARCFYDLEAVDGEPSAAVLNDYVLGAVGSQEEKSPSALTEIERLLILHLIAPRRPDRLKHPARIEATIQRLMKGLQDHSYDMDDGADRDAALYVVFPHRNEQWLDELRLLKFQPDPAEPGRSFDPEIRSHINELKKWLRLRFVTRMLYRMPDKAEEYWLEGDGLALRLESDRTVDSPWAFAFAERACPLRVPADATMYDVSDVPLEFLVPGDDRRQYRNRRNWTRYFPPPLEKKEDTNRATETLSRFLRCTNQLDLLLCYSEIFPCDIQSAAPSPGMECIRAIPREDADHSVPAWLRSENGMFEYFQQRLDSNKPGARRIVLTTDDTIRLIRGKWDEWVLQDIEFDEGKPSALLLERQSEAGEANQRHIPSGSFFIRAFDHYGQVELIDRRGKAIDQLKGFRYLLHALAAPAPIWMTTGVDRLPLPLPRSKVDDNKQAVLRDILRARPIYALQGPPGTGKTTLVAHLTREILAEDPTAQILITAQAHGAVYRLQEAIRDAFAEVPEEARPLAIRLGIDEEEESIGGKDGTVELHQRSLRQETIAILQSTRSKLSESTARTGFEAEWVSTVEQFLLAGQGGPGAAGYENFTAFERLIREGANIVFCTTSAADLEEIAKGEKTFDWSIVEEAGKVHGYDLALPMYVGHRWLLVGDQQQLKAYRFEDFNSVLEPDEMGRSMSLLERLAERNPDLIDGGWLRTWKEMQASPSTERVWAPGPFLARARRWLKTFDNIYEILRPVTREELVTKTQSVGAAVGMLTNQYRMHPAIGQLVSETYYNGSIENQTGTIESPVDNVVHGLIAPASVAGIPIVWIDVRWCRDRDSPLNCREVVPPHGNRYSNQAEIEAIAGFCQQLAFTIDPTKPLKVAVLSPYNVQKDRLERALGKSLPTGYPSGLVVKEGLYGRRLWHDGRPRFTHTVDSFQGNEADVIIVSLTRNNTADPECGLGFLAEPDRLNVLLSRAQRLLVFVGSWRFFRHQVGHLDPDVDRRHRLLHWKNIMTILERSGKPPHPCFVRLRYEDGSFRRII